MAALTEASCTETGPIPAAAGQAHSCRDVVINNCSKITVINCGKTHHTASTPSALAELGADGTWVKMEASQQRERLGWWRPRGWITLNHASSTKTSRTTVWESTCTHPAADSCLNPLLPPEWGRGHPEKVLQVRRDSFPTPVDYALALRLLSYQRKVRLQRIHSHKKFPNVYLLWQREKFGAIKFFLLEKAKFCSPHSENPAGFTETISLHLQH